MGCMVVRLTLPFPPNALHPNSRVHWRLKAAQTAHYREEIGWIGKEFASGCHPERCEHTIPFTPPVKAVVTFVVPDRRPRDLDNLLASLKAAWDGLTDAGVLEGDDAARFAVERSEIRYEPPKHLERCRKMQYRGFAGSPNPRAKCTCGSIGGRYVLVSLEESTDG